jgi:hypothetical protein
MPRLADYTIILDNLFNLAPGGAQAIPFNLHSSAAQSEPHRRGNLGHEITALEQGYTVRGIIEPKMRK